jgi:hypothetical protein
MDDEALLAGFEACTLPLEAFSHREHVRVAWLILRAHPRFEDGAQRFCAGLRRFAQAHGKSGLYHETITWAYLVLVNERLRRDPAGGFDDFVRDSDLLAPDLGALAPFYQRDVVRSDRARAVFVLPHSGGPARASQAPTSTQAFCPSTSPSTETTITSASTLST